MLSSRLLRFSPNLWALSHVRHKLKAPWATQWAAGPGIRPGGSHAAASGTFPSHAPTQPIAPQSKGRSASPLPGVGTGTGEVEGLTQDRSARQQFALPTPTPVAQWRLLFSTFTRPSQGMSVPPQGIQSPWNEACSLSFCSSCPLPSGVIQPSLINQRPSLPSLSFSLSPTSKYQVPSMPSSSIPSLQYRSHSTHSFPTGVVQWDLQGEHLAKTYLDPQNAVRTL